MEACFVSSIRSLAPWFGGALCAIFWIWAPIGLHSESLSELPSVRGQDVPSAIDPDLKVGGSCRGLPSSKQLVAALPTYIKELVVQWPRAGSRNEPEGCVAVARLTVIDHQGLITTLSVELHRAPQTPPKPDYRVIEDDGLPRSEMSLQPSSEHPEVVVSLAGPPEAGRDSLERTLEFVPLKTLAQAFGAL